MRKTFVVSVEPKDENDKREFWFQAGTVTSAPDFSRRCGTHKSFRTTKKFATFLRSMKMCHPDLKVVVMENQKNTPPRFYDVL